jgi:hypothetical protein
VLLLATCIIVPTVALTYLWASRTLPYVVDEPLSITDYPSIIRTHPGENSTLNILIENSADVDYSVTLSFAVNNTIYQQTYMQFSNLTYTITPGSNSIAAWCVTDKKAPSVQLSLTIGFHRE